MSGRAQLVLAFEDGPDHLSTPRFLRLLERHDVRATFFVLGVQVRRDAGLAREMADAGHELAVHGWDHRPLALRAASTHDRLARARDLIAETTGQPVRWFRPPGGLITMAALQSCRRLGLTPVPSGRLESFRQFRRLRSGAPRPRTLRLRDADHDQARIGSWRPALDALSGVLDACRDEAVVVGPLGEIWRPAGAGQLAPRR